MNESVTQIHIVMLRRSRSISTIQRRVSRCFPVALCGLLLCLTLALPSAAQSPSCPLPTWRFGVDMNEYLGQITDYDVAALHIGWYSDWRSRLNPARPGGIEYAQLLWVFYGSGPSLESLGPEVDANPGSLWMIGNEPECTYGPGGGNNTPEQYADVYHQLYHFIKSRDPTAQIAIGGVVQPTPLRLKWLDLLLDYYQATYDEPMPVDVWNIHNVILQELQGDWGCGIPRGLTETQGRLYGIADNDNIEIFKQHIVDFRTWMRDRGQRDKPLIISEYGVVMPAEYGFPPERVNAYMNATFDYLLTARDDNLGYPADENRLVQRWLWFSLNEQPFHHETGMGFNGALFDYRYPRYPGVMTPMGLNFQRYTDALLAGEACLTGTIRLRGHPSPPHPSYAITVTVSLYPVGCPYPDIRSVQTDSLGRFSVCHVTPGDYDIVVKAYNTLANRLNGVQVTREGASVDLGLLCAGDANNDNRVDLADFSLLAAAYGTCRGNAAFDHRTDFSGDGCIDLLDFSLLAAHFGQVGALYGCRGESCIRPGS
ncbi:MAG: hypothetical protein H5T68_12340 [Chloroflexi bacterium]|nr:hypothetical protein [Chloroflexota bacterium]